MKNENEISLTSLFLAFFQIGAFTFGGGIAMLPMLKKECIEKHNWATEEELLNYFAIGQCTPGIIAVNTATFIGFKLRKLKGAVVATTAVVLPGVIVILLLATALKLLSDNPYFLKAFAGIRVAVVAIILNSIANIVKKSIKSVWMALIAIATFLLVMFAGFSPVIVVLLTILAAIISFVIEKRTSK